MRKNFESLFVFVGRRLKIRVKSKQKPWTIILLVYVGSIADLIR